MTEELVKIWNLKHATQFLQREELERARRELNTLLDEAFPPMEEECATSSSPSSSSPHSLGAVTKTTR
jgi:hypothetical protein